MNSGAVNESSVVNTIIKGLQVLVEGTMKTAGAKKKKTGSRHTFSHVPDAYAWQPGCALTMLL